MKIGIFAHPDDCALWGNPKDYDKIILCFLDRYDNYKVFLGRKKALREHPLADKITCLNLVESGYNRDKSKIEEHQKNYTELVKLLKKELKGATEVFTHNDWGEYGHSEHILVNQAVRQVATCPVYALDGFIPHSGKERIEVDIDLDLYDRIKAVYERAGAWTWRQDYKPQPKQYYYKVK